MYLRVASFSKDNHLKTILKKAVIGSSFSQPFLIINHFLSCKPIIPLYISAVVSPTTAAPIGPSPNTMTKGPASKGKSLGSYIAINYLYYYLSEKARWFSSKTTNCVSSNYLKLQKKVFLATFVSCMTRPVMTWKRSCPLMYKQTDTPAQVQRRRAALLKTCAPWTVKWSFF